MKPTSLSATLDQLAADTVWLRRLAASLVKDQAVAEDLVHDTIEAAVARPPRDDRPLRPWLVRVLINRIRMYGRGAARRSRREQAVAALAVAPATPDALVDRLEIQRMLAGLVLELSHPLREVVLLRYVEGLSSAAIGRRLGIADGTVRWRLKQALDQLRSRLDQRTPQRAWIAPLAGFAGVPRGTSAGSTLLVAVGAAVLAVVAVIVLAWRALPDVEPVAHAGALGQRASASEAVASFVARGEASNSPHAAALAGPAAVSSGPDVRVTGTVVDRDGPSTTPSSGSAAASGTRPRPDRPPRAAGATGPSRSRSIATACCRSPRSRATRSPLESAGSRCGSARSSTRGRSSSRWPRRRWPCSRWWMRRPARRCTARGYPPMDFVASTRPR
jgi:RNA polymerase sigma factor (sigma-70 family)